MPLLRGRGEAGGSSTGRRRLFERNLMVAKIKLPLIQKKMIETFQCPGCALGLDVQCGAFELHSDDGNFSCVAHVAGTAVGTILARSAATWRPLRLARRRQCALRGSVNSKAPRRV